MGNQGYGLRNTAVDADDGPDAGARANIYPPVALAHTLWHTLRHTRARAHAHTHANSTRPHAYRYTHRRARIHRHARTPTAT